MTTDTPEPEPEPRYERYRVAYPSETVSKLATATAPLWARSG